MYPAYVKKLRSKVSETSESSNRPLQASWTNFRIYPSTQDPVSGYKDCRLWDASPNFTRQFATNPSLPGNISLFSWPLFPEAFCPLSGIRQKRLDFELTIVLVEVGFSLCSQWSYSEPFLSWDHLWFSLPTLLIPHQTQLTQTGLKAAIPSMSI